MNSYEKYRGDWESLPREHVTSPFPLHLDVNIINHECKLEIKEATELMFEDYYYLRCDPINMKWTGHVDPPNKEKLREWYLKQINEKERLFFLGYVDNKIVGYLYLFYYVEELGFVSETGHGVHSDYYGKGYGREIIEFALNYSQTILKVNAIVGWISDDNVKSQINVLKNGYERSQTAEIREINGEEKLFLKFYKRLN